MEKIVLHAEALDGYLRPADSEAIATVRRLYQASLDACRGIEKATDGVGKAEAEERLTRSASDIGHYLESVVAREKAIHVYSFETPQELHAEASRLVAKLRNPGTGHAEFIYYIQRAYELLFAHVFCNAALPAKRSIITPTPVTNPCLNYAAHRIPDIDCLIRGSVLCVMLRGALLPSMIISKEIEEYSSTNEVPPFALFKIKRDESKKESDMEYILDLDKSFFDPADLDGKSWIFADPMNATGGSLVTIVKHLESIGVRARSIKFINVISTLKGSLRIARAIPHCEVHTLWMDPVLNDDAYILPGLGDAGDRLNGKDLPGNPRNMIQLIADYGSDINNLYRSQVRKIEETVLGGRK